MQKITPFLWFNDDAEDAVNFYTSVFKDARIADVTRYSEQSAAVSGRPQGSVMTITFEIKRQQFIALNGGPVFTFSPAISLLVDCPTQDEVDELWEKLSEGGATEQCGWLKDKYGVSWQIVPTALGRMLQDKDPEKSKRVMEALLKMTKIDTNVLEQAYAG